MRIVVFSFFLFTLSLHAVRFNDALYESETDLGAYSQGGTATAGDMSYIEGNPANYGLSKGQYSMSLSSTFSGDRGFDFADFGILDSHTNAIVGAMRIRQAGINTGGFDRKFSLALAHDFSQGTSWEKQGPTSFGVGADYYNIEGGPQTSFLKKCSFNVGIIQGLWFIPIPINFGLSINGLNNINDQKKVSTGLTGFFLDGVLAINADLLFAKGGYQQATAGFSITAKEYFNVKASVGYNQKQELIPFGLGFYIQSQNIRIFYVFHTSNTKIERILQNIGLDFMIAL